MLSRYHRLHRAGAIDACGAKPNASTCGKIDERWHFAPQRKRLRGSELERSRRQTAQTGRKIAGLSAPGGRGRWTGGSERFPASPARGLALA